MGTDAQVDGTGGQSRQCFPPLPGTGRACEQGAGQAQPGHQGRQRFKMLPGQDLRRGHQGRLPPALGGEPDAGRRHHGLAAAHIPLTQAVHGAAGGHVTYGILHGTALGVRQREGQGVIKGIHGDPPAHRAGHVLPAAPQQPEAAGQQEQLLESQTAPGLGQRLRRVGEVDVFVSIVDVAQVVLPPHLIRQHVRQQLPAGVQPLPHRLRQHQLADACRQGVDGHDAPCQVLATLRLQQRVHHLVTALALHLAVEDVDLAPMEAVFPVLLIEEHHIQRSCLVHGTGADDGAAAGDAVGGGVGGDHGPDADILPLRQVTDGAGQCPILVGAGKVSDEITQGGDAQLLQSLGPCLSDALDIPHVGG